MDGKKKVLVDVILYISGMLLCMVLFPTLIINLTLFAKTVFYGERHPGVLGYMPMIVTSSSMDAGTNESVKKGAFIVVKKVDTRTLDAGDIISFETDSEVITHRIVRIETIDNEEVYITKGDSPYNGEDANPVYEDYVIGEMVLKVNGIGYFFLFLQKTEGLLMLSIIAGLIYIIYVILRKRYYGRIRGCTSQELADELAKLRKYAETE